ncbi:hypothetical protein QJS04_geneDACA006532 [Acorus gramineus]|uniref:Gamma-tubulin complex component n=1 Tax=Acorus gramineus TaxID=55184 RepID=A0AAV9AUY1_ACOGR|nr:hypothetical protein QJS04_geneDACA006532 [Acorus gramineus]
MGSLGLDDVAIDEVPQGFISRLYSGISNDYPFVEPLPALRTNEPDLVRDVLRMLQGFSGSFFSWDESARCFHFNDGVHVPHLSPASLAHIVDRFVHGATCLQRAELFVTKVQTSHVRSPTLRAFAYSVSLWLERLRDVALNVEEKTADSSDGRITTLLELTNCLSSICAGAECLVQVVQGTVPGVHLDPKSSAPGSEIAVHILDHLYMKLNDVCPVQGGEEEAYHMLLFLFIGSLLPYIEGLDSWLYDGILEDAHEEMFFYTNKVVAIDEEAFWEKSYLLRSWRHAKIGSEVSQSTRDVVNNKREERERIIYSSARGKDQKDMDAVVCPVFMKDIAREIVSAGKSLQLVRHVRKELVSLFDRGDDYENYGSRASEKNSRGYLSAFSKYTMRVESNGTYAKDEKSECDDFRDRNAAHIQLYNNARCIVGLTLSEVFCISLEGLIADGDHIFEYFRKRHNFTPDVYQICKFHKKQELDVENREDVQLASNFSEKSWYKLFVDAVLEKNRKVQRKPNIELVKNAEDCSSDAAEPNKKLNCVAQKHKMGIDDGEEEFSFGSSFLENPVVAVCRDTLDMNKACWSELNISTNLCLPALNDENMREAIFGERNLDGDASSGINELSKEPLLPRLSGTDYSLGFQFDGVQRHFMEDNASTLATLYHFPTLLPCFQDDRSISEFLPFQGNSTLASRVLKLIQNTKLKTTPFPVVVIQECLVVYIKQQVDYVGKIILSKLMNGWRLMDELSVLRAIYLLGSGDLLQHLLVIVFDKLDKQEKWDDEFELNTFLQESIRNSADGMLLGSPDSLVVTIAKNEASDEHSTKQISGPHVVHYQQFGIDALDMLSFTYKVPWPLELIANLEAVKKYNQVMNFLLKVKRAKYVLDKARRWMWKDNGRMTINRKRHLLVEQKLLHFVDAFHQYIMDRAFHSAWLELCKGMESASSLDDVIDVHEAYLLSIQRQCFVSSDKLWAMIASRVKTILGLALDFHSVLQTLCSGGAAPAIKVRCEAEVDQIEKQFDDCLAFLLRVLSFKLNVGHFPHLADLVTRINYNYFYMSDSGNLLTVPSFETTTSKPGKTYLARPE